MRNFKLAGLCALLSLAFALTFMPQQVAAQQSGGTSNSTQSTQTTTRTTEAAQPNVQVTRTTTQSINPLWIGLGAIALLAIIAIIAMSARGRGRDSVAVVSERETVIRKD